ncbi:MAG: YbaN family protein [Proteobacteria bacterium]|nr:YbaN family protein [Pseudomonadota bacterium]MDA1354736.1 YbaN family protein [Pseudomonadota bacterium]
MTEFNGTSRPSLRIALVAFGWASLVLGMIGALVPVMPSMVFLLVSLWCFSKGSERFHAWLYGHKMFGPSIRLWSEHRAIPRRAKIATLGGIALSVAILVALMPGGSILLLVYCGINAAVALFILSRPSGAPKTTAALPVASTQVA